MLMDLVIRNPTASIFVDFTIPNPLTVARQEATAAKPLAHAELMENSKRKKYHHLQKHDTEMIPFVIETTGGFGEDAIKLLKRIAEKIPASRRGTRETRDFKKLMMAKLSITLMRGNLRLLSHFKDNYEPQGQA